ncbi:hypothetical protein CVT24_001923 [Panaeolus cyanescens]|uniref:Protein kinase domain-containing protein n=1 Tax=Panaeolus cyanescens TaxID=181874 RepID=A0A409WXZ9_9AGAR|nr:hypothetical protein CVT24_001923 [Panaeolus cyanescens]
MADELEKRTSTELYWVEREPWLKSHGYKLRPRYSPDWVPSWKADPTKYDNCVFQEDAHVASRISVGLDATRISDGLQVYIKRVVKDSDEQRIIEYFMDAAVAQTAHRYVVSFLEILDNVPNDAKYVLVVMPLLQEIRIPRFDTIGECIDCVEQLLEAVQFLHHHNIAHRDCQQNNIRMEGHGIFPHGFHPQYNYRNVEYTGDAVAHYTRTQRPPRYLLIDFGISIRYPASEKEPRALPWRGGDRTVPEFQNPATFHYPYNPFPTDVYYIGNAIRQIFMEEVRLSIYH